MKKNKIKNNTIIIGLIFSLAITISGWAYYYDTANVLKDIVIEQDDDNKKLSIEIANLEDVIVEKGNDLIAKEKVIEQQKSQIKKQDETIKDKEHKLTLLKAENEKLKKEYPTSKQVSRGVSNSGQVLTVNASAYTAYCWEGCTGKTATGYNVSNTIYYNGYRIVATDPKIIPLYSIIEIDGFNERFISLDTGGAIKGNKIDILMKSESEANKFGRKNLNIKVIRRGR